MNAIDYLSAALSFVGSSALIAAGLVYWRTRGELASVRQAKADLLTTDTRAERLEDHGLRVSLVICEKCTGYGGKGCVRCSDCSGDGFRSRVVGASTDPAGIPGIPEFMAECARKEFEDLRHQFEAEREARRAAEARVSELEESRAKDEEFLRSTGRALKDAGVSVERCDGGEWVVVLPVDEHSVGVNADGVRWDGDVHHVWAPHFYRSSSNFDGTITYHNGTLDSPIEFADGDKKFTRFTCECGGESFNAFPVPASTCSCGRTMTPVRDDDSQEASATA